MKIHHTDPSFRRGHKHLLQKRGIKIRIIDFFHFHLQPFLTPTPELCKVQGFVLHPTWCRASPSPVRSLCRNWGNSKKCHAALGSASNKIKDLRDPEIVDPELDSGHGSGCKNSNYDTASRGGGS